MTTFKGVLRFLLRSGKRLGITIVGLAVVVLGLIMLLTPGPGMLVIAGGLAILSVEYTWAQVLLERARARARDAARKVRRKSRRGRTGEAEPPGAA